MYCLFVLVVNSVVSLCEPMSKICLYMYLNMIMNNFDKLCTTYVAKLSLHDNVYSLLFQYCLFTKLNWQYHLNFKGIDTCISASIWFAFLSHAMYYGRDTCILVVMLFDLENIVETKPWSVSSSRFICMLTIKWKWNLLILEEKVEVTIDKYWNYLLRMAKQFSAF